MHGHFFHQLLTILTASAIVVALFHRLRMPATLGYLGAGVLIGPGMLGLVGQQEDITAMAEFGVVFLLFSLGLEFSLSRVLAMRRLVFGLGGSQVLICTGAFFLIGRMAGLEVASALIIGGALALSSTAIVTRELGQRGELHARHGQVGVAILLFQDLASVLFLILIAALAGVAGDGLVMELGQTFLRGVALFLVLMAIGQWVLPRVFFEVAKTRSEELFVLTALVVALLAAVATEHFGLSMALGGFIAGMMLGESHYRHQIEAEIRPFRDVLLGIFFVSVGMLLDLGMLLRHWHWVLLLTAGLLIFKTALITMLGWVFGEDRITGLRAALVLAQGGEFGFAMLALAGSYALVDFTQSSVVLAVIILTMAVTPLMVRYNAYLAERVVKPRPRTGIVPQNTQLMAESTHALHDHVIICGFGRVGQAVGRILRREDIPYVAIDEDPTRVNEVSVAGENIHFGDAKLRAVLEALGIERARMAVISFSDFPQAMSILRQLRTLRPDLPVLVRTADDRNLEQLQAAGATEVVPETLEASLTLASHVLAMLDMPLERVTESIQGVREERYRLLHGYFHGRRSRVTDAQGQALEVLHAVALPDGARAVGRRLDELGLEKIGASVQAVRHPDGTEREPEPELELGQGDVVILHGSAHQVESAEVRLLRG